MLTRSAPTLDARPHLSHVRLATLEEIGAEHSVWEDWVTHRYEGNPFLSLNWHLVWLKHFTAPPTEIHYIKVLDHQQPVAYFPLILERKPFHGVRVRILRYAGNLYSPINCPILGIADRAAVFDYVVQNVLPALSWQVLLGDELPAEYPGVDELQQALLRGGHRVHLSEGEGNWIFVQKEVTPEAFHSGLGPNLRSDTRRFMRKLDAAGCFQFRLVSEDLTPKEITDYQLVFSRSWKEPEIDPTFHPELMEAMARRGCLRLGLAYLDERPIAAQLWLVSARRGYIVKLAYDEAYAKFKVGTVLTWKIIEKLISADRMNFFDYLRGDDEYKKRWAPIQRQRFTLLGFHHGLAGQALCGLDQRLLPWIRRSRILNAAKGRAASWLRQVTASGAS
jgi:CelD/BcsL family acetyltransferase involved in cellulose biosynthesis